MRTLTYRAAIDEATVQCMAADPAIFLAGQSIGDHKGVYGTTVSAARRFGPDRVIDVPNCENAFAGMAVGAASQGLRPMVVYTRDDFMFLAMDAVFNLAAKWRYMFGGQGSAPIVLRGVVGHGWGQGATHSQSLHALFGHFPGLHVAAPATAADAKGLLVSALTGDDPVVLIENRALYEVEGPAPDPPLRTVLIENRALYEVEGPVPEGPVAVPLGSGRVVRAGTDVTVVAVSRMVPEAERAAGALAGHGISVEVVDPRSVRPLDERIVLESVARTGRLVVADTSWARYGFSAEIAAVIAEHDPGLLRAPIRRVTPPDCPSPVSGPLEDAFNPDARAVADACLAVLGERSAVEVGPNEVNRAFAGPY